MTFVDIANKNAGDEVTEAMWDAIKVDINEGVFRPLAESELSVAATSIDIQNIPQTHNGLLIVFHLRTSRASATDLALVRFNNDSGANYDYDYQFDTNATQNSADAYAQTSLILPSLPGNTAPTGAFSQHIMWVPHYVSSSIHKSVLFNGGNAAALSSGNVFLDRGAGYWRSTSAITRVTVSPSVGPNLNADSRLTIYGTGAGV